MIQAGVIGHLQNRMDGSCFRVIGTIHQAADAGMNGCSRAHRARLNCSKQFAVAETVITEVSSGLAQGHDFRVGGGIEGGEVLIPASSNYAAGADDDCSYGHFVRLQRALGQRRASSIQSSSERTLGGERSSEGLAVISSFSVDSSHTDVSRQWYSMRVMGMTGRVLAESVFGGPDPGTGVTFRYQDPKEIYTEQYPLERPQVAERYRGAPRLNVNPDTDETLCIACDLCALACPENLIVVISERNEKTRRKELTNFTYDLSRCMFCGLCEDACPVDALELTQDFELANYTREGMIWDRETLEKGPQPTVYQK